MAQKWYAIQTYYGSEQSVKKAIERLRDELSIPDRIAEVVVPTEDLIEIDGKSGKSKTVARCLYPGYVFAQLEMDKDMQHRIQSLSKVSRFIGETESPSELSEKDIQLILDKARNKAPAKHKIFFDTAEQVRIVDGPFENFTGVVEEYDAATGKLRLNVSIFGRSTPVEMLYSQVKKIV
ncbi:MAG: transcription termination/antitermination protein NusG [Helicobacteraceae bacterium]|jgi:transcriptional antiterminator NusG|nr:transcription termination/antitermination protein NusG [Helicobacteraceae bacterium]MDR2034219.1 transcription termination/antitermination protein NusG [Helicobacteraceae bacterium]